MELAWHIRAIAYMLSCVKIECFIVGVLLVKFDF